MLPDQVNKSQSVNRVHGQACVLRLSHSPGIPHRAPTIPPQPWVVVFPILSAANEWVPLPYIPTPPSSGRNLSIPIPPHLDITIATCAVVHLDHYSISFPASLLFSPSPRTPAGVLPTVGHKAARG